MGRRTKPRLARAKLRHRIEQLATDNREIKEILADTANAQKMAADTCADLRQALERESGLRSYMSRTMGRLQHAIDTTAAVLGPHFIGLPPAVVNVGPYELPPMWRLVPHQPVSAASIGQVSARPEDLVMALKSLPTYCGSAHLDRFRGMLHVVLKNTHGDLAYAIDDNSLAAMPYAVRVEQLAREFACVLSNTIEKGREGVRRDQPHR